MKHIYWFDLQSPLGEFPVPTFHRLKTTVRKETYLKRRIHGHLLLFIEKYHQNDKILFWSDLILSHYVSSALHCLEANNVSFVCRDQNPTNVVRWEKFGL